MTGKRTPLELQITVTLEERGGRTKMILKHAGFPPGEMRELCEAGWNNNFAKLVESLKQQGRRHASLIKKEVLS